MLCLLFLGMPFLAAAQEDGHTKYFHANGVVSSEGELVNGLPEGHWKAYYETGVLRSEGLRRGHELDSIWRFYDPDGELTTEIGYAQGRKDGPSRKFAKDGTVLSEELFVEDLRQGMARYFREDGSLHKEITFKDGKEDGRGVEYAPDGRIITLFTYGAGILRRKDEINRLDAAGLRQGPWKEFHPNGKVRSEGSYVDDRKQGIFKVYDREGNLKDMVKFDLGAAVPPEEQVMMLDIKRTYHPTGKVATMGSYSRTGSREGLFKEYDPQGTIVSATIFMGDRAQSRGLVDDRGVMIGIWTEYYSTGEKRAEGEYEEGRRTGEWMFYHRTGEVEQRGNYVNGLPQGKWRWSYPSGKMHREENYRRGREDGSSVEYDEAGNILLQGEYIDGLREGEWVYHVGDHKEQGNYKDGLKEGTWTHVYNESGKRHFIGDFINGERHGRHRWFWPNGQLRLEGRYTMGMEQGDHTHYDELGQVMLVIRYKDGVDLKLGGERVPQVP